MTLLPMQSVDALAEADQIEQSLVANIERGEHALAAAENDYQRLGVRDAARAAQVMTAVMGRRKLVRRFSVLVQRAERAIAQANPPMSPSERGILGNQIKHGEVEREQRVISQTMLGTIREAHNYISDEEFEALVNSETEDPMTRQQLIDLGKLNRQLSRDEDVSFDQDMFSRDMFSDDGSEAVSYNSPAGMEMFDESDVRQAADSLAEENRELREELEARREQERQAEEEERQAEARREQRRAEEQARREAAEQEAVERAKHNEDIGWVYVPAAQDANHLQTIEAMLQESQGGRNVIGVTDAIQLLKALPASSIDLLLTDIPYARVNKPTGGLRILDKGEANEETFNLADFANEVVRVTGGNAVIFCGKEQFSPLYQHFDDHDLATRMIVWEKTNPSPMNAGVMFLSGVECAVHFRKDHAPFNEQYQNTVFRFPSGSSLRHPTEKPLDMFKWFVQVLSNPGDLVCDPCMGSGTAALAAQQMGRRYLCSDISQEDARVALDRLKEGN